MVTMEYTDVHRALVQSMMSLGIVELSVAQDIFARIVKMYGEGMEILPDSLSKAVALVNKNIATFDQKIVLFEFSMDNKSHYIHYNTTATLMNKFQSTYSESDIEYFQLILKEIATKNLCLPTQILNLTTQLRENNMKKTHAQSLVDKWIQQGYFYKDDEFNIHFGAKMLVEFKSHLLNCFPNNIIPCELCKEIVFSGSQCSNCHVEFHKSCILKFHTHSYTCASCKEPWVEG